MLLTHSWPASNPVSETIAHTRLVGVIITWLRVQYPTTSGLCLFCDCPPVLETEKPSPIEGFFPDVCAISTPPALTLIGEAKTALDLETQRSYKQFLAFLRFLVARPKPTLVVATPWQATATARSIIKRAQRESHAKAVQLRFLNDGDAPC
jgi:hypothetical protein